MSPIRTPERCSALHTGTARNGIDGRASRQHRSFPGARSRRERRRVAGWPKGRTKGSGRWTTVLFMDRSTRSGIAFALLAGLFWGVSGAVAADAFAAVTPAQVAEVRALATAIFFIPFALYRGVLSPRGGLIWFALFGANLAIVNVTFYWAIDRLGVGPGATIQFL